MTYLSINCSYFMFLISTRPHKLVSFDVLLSCINKGCMYVCMYVIKITVRYIRGSIKKPTNYDTKTILSTNFYFQFVFHLYLDLYVYAFLSDGVFIRPFCFVARTYKCILSNFGLNFVSVVICMWIFERESLEFKDDLGWLNFNIFHQSALLYYSYS